MNENAKKWVEALRSGEYEQATGVLRDTSGCMCCLGVACELYRQEFGGEWIEPEFVVSDVEIAEDGELSRSVQEWLGLRSSSGLFEHNSLIDENDHGTTFAEIADIIEREPNGLFD